jgi:hypothetical protein
MQGGKVGKDCGYVEVKYYACLNKMRYIVGLSPNSLFQVKICKFPKKFTRKIAKTSI